MFQKDWSTTSEKKVVSTHPPLEEITNKIQNSEIIASPFKKINPKEDENINANLKDVKSLQQNNFTNQILGTIASQMDGIENNFPKSITRVEYEKLLFKPPEIKKKTIEIRNKNNELKKILAKKLEAVEFKPTDPSSKQQLNFLSGFETGSSCTEEQTNNSKEEDQINRIKYQNVYQ